MTVPESVPVWMPWQMSNRPPEVKVRSFRVGSIPDICDSDHDKAFEALAVLLFAAENDAIADGSLSFTNLQEVHDVSAPATPGPCRQW